MGLPIFASGTLLAFFVPTGVTWMLLTGANIWHPFPLSERVPMTAGNPHRKLAISQRKFAAHMTDMHLERIAYRFVVGTPYFLRQIRGGGIASGYRGNRLQES